MVDSPEPNLTQRNFLVQLQRSRLFKFRICPKPSSGNRGYPGVAPGLPRGHLGVTPGSRRSFLGHVFQCVEMDSKRTANALSKPFLKIHCHGVYDGKICNVNMSSGMISCITERLCKKCCQGSFRCIPASPSSFLFSSPSISF